MNPLKHEFALYWPDISSIIEQYPVHALVKIDDQALVHRLVRVLRLQTEDRCILFDRNVRVFVELGELAKQYVYIQIDAIEYNKPLTPAITFGLPLLKKEAFEEALYSLTELGVTTIQPLIAKKVHRAEWSVKETERFERIIIAAAEQSKHFVVPTIAAPLSLENFVQHYTKNFTSKIFFDPQGQSLSTFFEHFTVTATSHLLLMIGPEGDLTSEEKEMLKKACFIFVTLTPTVLRSQQAAAVGLGIFRTHILF